MSNDVQNVIEDCQDHFRVLVENCPTAFVIFRSENIIYANPACLSMLGYLNCDDLSGVCLFNHVAPEFRQDMIDNITQHFNSNKSSLKYKTLGLRSDGTLFSADFEITPINLKDGVASVAYITDSTHHRESEKALEDFEQKYRELANESTSIILRWNTSGKITFFNEYAQEYFGFTEEEIVGKNVIGTITSEQEFSSRDLVALMTDIRRDPTSFEHNENENIKKNGDRVWIAWKNKPIFDDDGQLTEILSVGMDSSKRKIAEEKIKKSEKELKAILYSMQDTYYKTDINGLILLVSPSVEQLLGYKKEEVENTKIQNLYVDPNGRNKLIKTLTENNGVVYNYPINLIRKNGDYTWISISSHFVYDDNDECIGIEGVGRDITQWLKIENSLRRSEDRFKAIFHAISDAVLYVDVHRNIALINPAVTQLFGYSLAELKNKSSLILYTHANDYAQLAQTHFNLDAATHQDLYEISYKQKDGSIFVGETFGTKIQDKKGEVIGFMAIIRDVSEKKRIDDKLKLSQKIFEDAGKAILVLDANFKIVDINDAFCEITGFSKEFLIGKLPWDKLSARHSNVFYHDIYGTLSKSGYWQGELWQKKKSGEEYPNWATISVVEDDAGVTNYYVLVYSDITEIKKTEERLEQLAHFDQLTGLPNRMLFTDRLHFAIDRAVQRNEYIAVMYIDLDGFKKVNDTLGHIEGDTLLKKISDRLKTCIREEDTVARLGGDEFAIIVNDLKIGKNNINDLNKNHYLHILAKRVISELYTTLTFEGRELYVSGSVGVATFPDAKTDSRNLLRNADQAMYYAKQSGKNTYQFFSQEMNAKIINRIRLESDLRLATTANEFSIHYQPKVNLIQNKVVGIEVLARWKHKIRGEISPLEFVSLAEDTDLIFELGQQILTKACQNMRYWIDEGNTPIPMAINISAKQFKNNNFVNMIHTSLDKENISANLLELEITESLLMEDIETTIIKLEKLRLMGVHISIDDFGTGYSSLSYLKKLPVDTVKIDQSFVKDISTDSDDRAIISAIISMANSLNLKVVAEGVENQQQLKFLKLKSCDEVQGFLFSKPVLFEDLKATISRIEQINIIETA